MNQFENSTKKNVFVQFIVLGLLENLSLWRDIAIP